jgi:hypothetical protein
MINISLLVVFLIVLFILLLFVHFQRYQPFCTKCGGKMVEKWLILKKFKGRTGKEVQTGWRVERKCVEGVWMHSYSDWWEPAFVKFEAQGWTLMILVEWVVKIVEKLTEKMEEDEYASKYPDPISDLPEKEPYRHGLQADWVDIPIQLGEKPPDPSMSDGSP